MTGKDIAREIDFVDNIMQSHFNDYGEETHRALQEAIKLIEQEQKTEWVPVTCLPKKNGRYLVTMRYSTHDTIKIIGYANNLYEVDKYDFADCKRPGWYGYDSEYGFFEYDNVMAWMKLPKKYKESEGTE